MEIIHEGMSREAEHVAERFSSVYGFNNNITDMNLDNVFVPMSNFAGHFYSSLALQKRCEDLFRAKKVLLLTSRDLYVGNSENDDWIFGFCSGDVMVAATARMKGFDNSPRSDVAVPFEHYLRRLETLAIHEIGHDVVRANHLLPAFWVNEKTGHRLELGPHCTDERCVMYEVVDIRAPPAEEGYLELGGEKKYNAGFDDLLERMYPDYFCKRCKDSIVVDESFHS